MTNQKASSRLLGLSVIQTAFLVLFFGIILVMVQSDKLKTTSTPDDSNEIAQIKSTKNLTAQTKLYKALIERVGPEQAQEDLFKSGLPFTGQTHLLNHTVGEYLYDKFGASGLIKCKDYFLASCDHGFVIKAIGAGGLVEVSKVMEVCQGAGPTVFVQCAHAVGHGFLASEGYRQLPLALKLCDEANAMISHFPLYNCHDGVFMENIWGIHEGKPSDERWVSADDPLYPCDAPLIAEIYRNACWSNQPSLMYQQFKGNIFKVGQFCLAVQNAEYKETCFNGLSRQIHPIAADSIDKTFRLCGLLPKNWINYCLQTNAVSAFSVGDRDVPFKICATITKDFVAECYNSLFDIMHAYAKTSKEYLMFCDKILESEWRNKCKS
jgi:hypothetical protein